MTRRCSLLGLFALTFSLFCGSELHAAISPKAPVETAQAAPAPPRKPSLARKGDTPVAPPKKFKDGELLVKFKPGVPAERKKNLHKKHGAEKLKEFDALRLHHLKLKKGMTVEEAMKLYQGDPDVQYAEPNFLFKLQAQPDDPLFGELWGLQNLGLAGMPGADIKAPAAWDITTGSADVVVATIDTGIDYTHPDLAGNVWVNKLEIPGNGIDDDGNGFIDDVYGIDASSGTGNPFDDNGHGTHVAGTIGAVGNNGTGVVGVNWNVKIMACKFLNAAGEGYSADAITCLQYIKQMKERGVPVVASNNSWGGGSYSQALLDAIDNEAGTLFIASAGNDAQDTDRAPSYPAAYPSANIISVAATDSMDELAYFSNYGKKSVDLAAPGFKILSTIPAINKWGIAGGYGTLSGTSMAAPHVTGVAALLKAADPSRDANVLRNLILTGGDPIPAAEGKTLTGKRLNAYGSLTCSDQKLFAVQQLPADLVPGVATVISVLSISCGSPLGDVSATTSGGETITLHDDGIAPDAVAGDGIFSASWIPLRNPERLTFTSPAGSATVYLPTPSIIHYVPAGNVGLPYRQQLKASGVSAPVQWSVVEGPLPPGLDLAPGSGEISGVPTEAGIWPVRVALTDALGQTVSRVVNLHVTDSPVVERWAAVKGTSADDVGEAVAADGEGNSYVVSNMSDAATPSILLVKYDPSGQELWSYRYYHPGRNLGAAVAVNAAGEAFVCGNLDDSKYVVLKISRNGELLWDKTYTVANYAYAYADGIAVGADNTLYLAGHTFSMEDLRNQVLTVKLSPSGEELWHRTYTSPIDGWANAVAVDASGNIYVAGTEGGRPDYDYNFLLMKYDAAGQLLWIKKEDNGTLQDQWEGLALDSAGNPYVSGHRIGMQVTRKYDTAGNMLWSADYDAWGTPNGYGIAVDSSGRAYVAGFKNGHNSDFNILCYSPQGELLWNRTSDSGGLPNDWSVMQGNEGAFSLALGPSGQIFATGYSWNGNDFDMLTIEYETAPLTITATQLPGGLLLIPYSHRIAVRGVAPFTWSVTAGTLPQGLSLDPVTGELSGTPTASGTFTFTVRVSDALGRTSSDREVTMSVTNLSAGFTLNQQVGYAPFAVQFTDTTVGAASTWAWDFGDGTSSPKQHPAHVYAAPGTYVASLTASNAYGSSTASLSSVTVLACVYPRAQVTADSVPPASFDDPQGAYAQASGGGSIMLQAYDFPGDLSFDRDITVKLRGGFDCHYSINTQTTGILGKLAVKSGKVVVENLRFK
ncbi:S8 family serine peptidase [Geomonas anaerohicana]|uniref:S8 family serine peptidase n=1 Tax=Geomonas anaerohicana TaxID=2798583 RepID=A0ABS0YB08_9BACT|nr:S8 family serine peptidase [Geomonas anaerohicana]MBJ6749134.1 S8 family serine peptidase [Geomonas anaerohicana]